MKVKAAFARSPGDALVLGGLTLTAPQSDEVLVRMIASGVSQIDLDAIDGRLAMPFPFVPGSEGAGIVEGVGGDVTTLSPGDAVIIGFDYCGQCPACVAGRPRACAAFADLNLSGLRSDASAPFEERDVHGRFFGQSSFATHVVCLASRAVKIARGSPLEALACLGGDVLIGAGTVLHAFRFGQGESLVVSGAGVVGLAATMTARAQGAATIVVAEADERRRKLASELGADVAVHTDENLADIVRSLAADGATFAIETTGAPHARQACVESLATNGTCAFVGPFGGDLDIDQSTPRSRIVSANDHAPPSILVPMLAAMHARGDLPLEQLVDFFPFEHVNDALQALRSGAVAKPVLRFSIGAFGDLDRAKVEDARADAPADPASEPSAAAKPTLVE